MATSGKTRAEDSSLSLYTRRRAQLNYVFLQTTPLSTHELANMQSTRMFAANALRQQSPMLRARAIPMVRMQARGFRTTQIRRAVPKEEQSAHTISQRLRTLKKIPPELIPLGVVLAAALIAAGYSMARKLTTDKTLRLTRTGKKGDH